MGQAALKLITFDTVFSLLIREEEEEREWGLDPSPFLRLAWLNPNPSPLLLPFPCGSENMLSVLLRVMAHAMCRTAG